MAWYDKLWKKLRGAVPVPGHPGAPAGVLLRRPGGPEGQELRHRGLVPPAAEVLRGVLLLQPGRRPGPAGVHPLQGRGHRKKGKTVTKTRTVLAHTLNNTCVAPPRMLIAFLENNLQADGSVVIPEALRPLHGRQGEAGKVSTLYPPRTELIWQTSQPKSKLRKRGFFYMFWLVVIIIVVWSLSTTIIRRRNSSSPAAGAPQGAKHPQTPPRTQAPKAGASGATQPKVQCAPKAGDPIDQAAFARPSPI